MVGSARWSPWRSPASTPSAQRSAPASAATPKGEWRTYGADLASTRYSPLDQINAGNFSKLEVAWRFKTDHLGPRPEYNYQSTPLMVGGVLYTTAGSRRAVVALDAATGEQLWMHREDEGKRGEEAPRRLVRTRPVRTGPTAARPAILYVTPGYRMIALDARTGHVVPSFGTNGVVDLKLEDDQEMDPVTGDIGLHAAPLVVKDTIIIGAAHTEGSRPVSRRNDKGYVRGYDVRTGKRQWIFHTIPRPGEYGYDTWQQGSEEYTGNTGVWAQMSADEELGIVYLPVEMPTGDYYGGHRPGRGPLRREPGGARREDRQAQVALPVHQARHLGLGPAVRADPGRRDDRRQAAQDRHAAEQAGLAVRVRPRDGRTDLAVRGAQGRGVGRAG